MSSRELYVVNCKRYGADGITGNYHDDDERSAGWWNFCRDPSAAVDDDPSGWCWPSFVRSTLWTVFFFSFVFTTWDEREGEWGYCNGPLLKFECPTLIRRSFPGARPSLLRVITARVDMERRDVARRLHLDCSSVPHIQQMPPPPSKPFCFPTTTILVFNENLPTTAP